MTAIADIRAAIVAELGGVPDIGQVQATRKNAAAPAELKAAFFHGGEVRAWIVSHTSLGSVSDTVGTVEDTHGWDIEGFVAFCDGSGERVLDDLIEAIRRRFLATDLGIEGLTTVTETQAGIAVLDRQPVVLGRSGGVLCAYARLRLITRVEE